MSTWQGWVRSQVLLCCLVAAVARSAAAADASNTPQQSDPAGSPFSEWDSMQDGLRRGIWTAYLGTAESGRDARGRTEADDVNQWVMGDDVVAKLAAIRGKAEQQSRAGQESAARQTLKEGMDIASEQARRLAGIETYWRSRLALDRQRLLWQSWLREAPASAAADSKSRLDSLEAGLIRELSPLGVSPADIDDLLIAYNEERIRLAALVVKQRVAMGIPLRGRERSLPCPEPAKPDSSDAGGAQPTGAAQPAGGAQPAGAAQPTGAAQPAGAAQPTGAAQPAGGDRRAGLLSSPSTELYYPDDAKRDGISGGVILRLTITAAGCMQRTEVTGSSGADELDDAALALSDYMRFRPATKAGQPVDSTLNLQVKFAIMDDYSDTGTDFGHFHRGRDLLGQREYGPAIEQLSKAIAADPRSAAALAARGTAYTEERNNELARADFDSALSIEPFNVTALLARARLSMSAGDDAAAINDLNTLLQVNGSDTTALYLRASAYRDQGDRERMIADGAELIRLAPDSVSAYWFRALIARERGELAKAIGAGDALIAAYPKDVPANRTAAAIYRLCGQDSKSLRTYDRIIELAPDEVSYLQRAEYRPTADKEGKRADIEAALHANPNSMNALRMRGVLQTATGQYTDAIASFSQMMEAHGESSELLALRGAAYSKSGQESLAQQDFAAARTQATNPQALNTLCWTMATNSVALEEALAACDAAIAAAPNIARYVDSRAFVLLRLGRYDEALAAYNDAVKLRPGSAYSHYGRAVIERRKGDKKASESDLRAALDADPRVADAFASYGVGP